jgi:predicted nucleotidyltransferase
MRSRRTAGRATPATSICGCGPRRIDLLTAIDGVVFEDCHARRQVISIDGVELPIIGLEDFKANKRASGRTQDLADLEALDDGSA